MPSGTSSTPRTQHPTTTSLPAADVPMRGGHDCVHVPRGIRARRLQEFNDSCVNVATVLQNPCQLSHCDFLSCQCYLSSKVQSAIPMSLVTAGVWPISKAEVLETSAASPGLSSARSSVKS